jgi:hypothetical protein
LCGFSVQIVEIEPNEVEIGPNEDIGQKQTRAKDSKSEKRRKRGGSDESVNSAKIKKGRIDETESPIKKGGN